MRFTAFFSIACLLALLGGSSSSSSEESKEIPSKSFTWNFFGKCCDKLKCPKNPVLAYYTTTTTSVASIYCTKSTNQVCATRRSLRGFSTDNDSDEQFPISPSAVQGSVWNFLFYLYFVISLWLLQYYFKIRILCLQSRANNRNHPKYPWKRTAAVVGNISGDSIGFSKRFLYRS